jgi:hypothetical protein
MAAALAGKRLSHFLGLAGVRREVLALPRGRRANEFAAALGPGVFLEYCALCLRGPQAPQI